VATHQFKFVVSDVDLTPEQIERVGQAVAQAGTLALADLTADDAITFRGGPGWWWRGIPPVDISDALAAFVSTQPLPED
jgi:hypothetical protein